MNRLQLTCRDPLQAHRDITEKGWPWLKRMLIEGHEMVVEFRQAKRSDAENRMLHAMLGYISKNIEWAGQKRDIDTWKRLLTAAWLRARGEPVEMLPALDGCGIDIVFRRTSNLTKKECAELIEYIFAWGAQNDIRIPDKSKQMLSYVDIETGEVTR